MLALMRKIAFIITMICLFILAFLLLNQKTIEITSKEDIFNLKDNEKIVVEGKVSEERPSGNSRIIKLDNGIDFYCENCPSYLNKKIKVYGIIEDYNSKKQINILKIEIL